MNIKFEYILQSKWIGDIMNEYLPDTGFFVEIGVGHTTTQESRKSKLKTVDLFASNTAELLYSGWCGIYIEPVKQFCDEAALLHKNYFERIKIVNLGASNQVEEKVIYGMETLIPNGILEYRDDLTGYKYDYPGTVVKCEPTSKILNDNACPKDIDFMTIDVEGYEDKVLLGIDFKIHLPKMLFIETTRTIPREVEKIIPKKYKQIKTDGFNTCWIIME